MNDWKHLVLGVAVLGIGASIADWFVQGTDQDLLNAGVPQALVGALVPEVDGEA